MATESVFGNEHQAEATRQAFADLFTVTSQADAAARATSLLSTIPGFPALADKSIQMAILTSIVPDGENERIARLTTNPQIHDTSEVRFTHTENALIYETNGEYGYQDVSAIHISRKQLDREFQTTLYYDRNTGSLKQITMRAYPWSPKDLDTTKVPFGKRDSEKPDFIVNVSANNELHVSGKVKFSQRFVNDPQVIELMESLSKPHNRPTDVALRKLALSET